MAGNKEKNFNARALLIIMIVLFILSLIPIYIIGLYAHPSVDDYYYGADTVQVWADTHSILSVISCSFKEMMATYQDWQGNFSAIFFMRLQPGIFGEQYYCLAPFLLISAYVICSLFFFYTVLKVVFSADKYRSGILAIALTFVSMQLTDTPSDSFYWYNGAIYYTFFYSLMLLLFALMIRMFHRRRCVARSMMMSVVCAVLAFFIGGSNYATALFSGILLVLAAAGTIYLAGVKKDFRAARVRIAVAFTIIALCELAGLFISMTAPGNAVRQASVGESTGLALTFAYTFAFGGYSLARVLSAPCIVFFLCITPTLYRIASKSRFLFRRPFLVLLVTFALFCSMGTPVFYAQGLRMPYRMMNIIFFSAYSLIAFNLLYFLGFLSRRYGDHANMVAFESLCKKMKQKSGRFVAVFVLCLAAFSFSCVGIINVSESEYESGAAAFSGLPLSASSLLSLLNGDAALYDSELNARDEYLRNTDESVVTVPALSVTPEPIYHSDITSDVTDWHNEHLAMYYQKESIRSE